MAEAPPAGGHSSSTMVHVQMEDVYDRALIEGLPEVLRQRVHHDEHRRFDNYVDLVVELARSVPDEQAAATRSADFTEAAIWQSHIDRCAAVPLLAVRRSLRTVPGRMAASPRVDGFPL